MSDVLIKVEGLSKKFCLSLKRSMAYGSFDIARSMLGISYNRDQLRQSEFWALDDVSFEVNRGDKLGFLGVNGSGKSTLLRLINGIFPPDKGRITVKGSIGALIAVGVGFHPYMTGRENIYLNGTIIGMTKNEIKKKFDEIVEFAEIGDFLDAPVSTYSSGMTVRLGFSIAIHCEPDILLVDEVLSVGDLGFALKCQKKMSEYRQNGGTFILVSHNMQMIRNTCEKAVWLDHGKVVDSGDIFIICDKYESSVLRNTQKNSLPDKENIFNYDNTVTITEVQFLNSRNDIVDEFQTGNIFKMRIYYECNRIVNNPIFTIGIVNLEGIMVIENYSHLEGLKIENIFGNGYVDFIIESINLKPSIYKCTITLSEGEILNKLEWHEKAHSFCIINDRHNINQGLFYPYPKWNFNDKFKGMQIYVNK